MGESRRLERGEAPHNVILKDIELNIKALKQCRILLFDSVLIATQQNIEHSTDCI